MAQTTETELAAHAAMILNFDPGIIIPKSFNVTGHSVTATQDGSHVKLVVTMELAASKLHEDPFTLTRGQFEHKVFFPLKEDGQVSLDNLKPELTSQHNENLNVAFAMDVTGSKIGGAGLNA